MAGQTALVPRGGMQHRSADDTTVFVSDIRSAQNLFQLLHAFQKCSGLEANRRKTEGLWLGANKNNPEEPLDIAWPKHHVFALGIHFSYDDEAAFQRNFEQTVLDGFLAKPVVP